MDPHLTFFATVPPPSGSCFIYYCLSSPCLGESAILKRNVPVTLICGHGLKSTRNARERCQTSKRCNATNTENLPVCENLRIGKTRAAKSGGLEARRPGWSVRFRRSDQVAGATPPRRPRRCRERATLGDFLVIGRSNGGMRCVRSRTKHRIPACLRTDRRTPTGRSCPESRACRLGTGAPSILAIATPSERRCCRRNRIPGGDGR